MLAPFGVIAIQNKRQEGRMAILPPGGTALAGSKLSLAPARHSGSSARRRLKPLIRGRFVGKHSGQFQQRNALPLDLSGQLRRYFSIIGEKATKPGTPAKSST